MKSVFKGFRRAIIACLLFASAPCLAAINNPGFETGTTSGWTIATNVMNSASVGATGANTGSYGLVFWSGGPYETDAYQSLTGIANGQYTLTAMFKNGGGQTSAYLYAKNCGGAVRQTSIPVSSGWTKVVVRGVQVTGGACRIGLYSVAAANQWVAMDNVTFTADSGPAYSFLQGGDVSRLTYIESLGAKYYQNGLLKDPMQILADNGFNFVRLRAFNDPGNAAYAPSNKMPMGFQNTTDILNLAKRAGNKGMKVQLSLNYSDWWADGCLQDVPHEWSGMSFAQIKTAVYNYTFDIVKKLKNQGTPPTMVSLGNQMQCGILLNPGNYGPLTNWSQLAQLLNSGAQAVKAASPTSKVMLHIDSPYNANWFFTAAVNNGVNFDVIGVSWYPYWESTQGHTTTDTLPELLTSLNSIGATYNKDIVIMETATNWNPTLSNGYQGQLINNGNVGYAQTPAGQRDYTYDLMNICKSVNNGRCVGIQWWDPIAVNQANFGWIVGGNNAVDNSTVFDWNHNAQPALTQAFKNNR
ncbi:arabinogalactan endo-beta-1,4-galactanase [Asticcacaulis sp. W401b]|uniref:glycoside hydrolase family 53 protein n=1 Tax=Asticcacaulis sp. W401b TaxID=3388666 RepID=UPI003970C375